ncbi:MAG: NTP transferase domain-containing protein [Verrucomicrobiota bacterium]|nr:MAG: NTP transferase domain-containing protein [Verrucomicrobiota bacterium]
MKDISVVILAAGMGRRFGAAKQIVALSRYQWPLIRFNLVDAQKAGVRHVVIVTRSSLLPYFQQELVPALPEMKFDFVFQDQEVPHAIRRAKPWGTGHALLCAEPFTREQFVVLNADDYYGREAVDDAVQFLCHPGAQNYGCVGYFLENTLSPNGAVSRGVIRTEGNRIIHIEEYVQIQRNASGVIEAVEHRSQRKVTLPSQQSVSLNLFALNRSIFPILERKFKAFLKDNASNKEAEFFLPTAVTASDAPTPMELIPTQAHWLGLTYPDDLPYAGTQLNHLIAQGYY